MSAGRITELRLTAFKSFVDVAMPLESLTLIIGRNGSGKSNALVVLTTHSPTLLNALDGDDHSGVIVVERERTSGRSTARRLVDLPGYVRLMAGSRLGDAVARGRLAEAGEDPPPVSESELDRLLGIA